MVTGSSILLLSSVPLLLCNFTSIRFSFWGICKYLGLFPHKFGLFIKKTAHELAHTAKVVFWLMEPHGPELWRFCFDTAAHMMSPETRSPRSVGSAGRPWNLSSENGCVTCCVTCRPPVLLLPVTGRKCGSFQVSADMPPCPATSGLNHCALGAWGSVCQTTQLETGEESHFLRRKSEGRVSGRRGRRCRQGVLSTHHRLCLLPLGRRSAGYGNYFKVETPITFDQFSL